MSSPAKNISVIFATYKRGDILRLTLDSLMQLNTQGFSHEIILVSNALDRQTDEIALRYINAGMPLIYLVEPTPGKNAALLAGLNVAQGDLLVFTDDDIIADREWLNALYQGAISYQSCALFGGRILPDYPANYLALGKDIDFNHWFLRSAYVIANWDQGEGIIQAGHIWGPNMAVRRAVFDSGITFNPDIGPKGADYVMGSETEFLKRAEKKGFTGMYLPKALVYHQIRAEQLSLAWLKGRALRAGKGQAALVEANNAVYLFGVPRYLWKKYMLAYLKQWFAFLMNREQRFDNTIQLYLVKGQIQQYKKKNHE